MDFDGFLDQLSPPELTVLRSKVETRLGPQATLIEPDDPVLEEVFRALSTTLGNRGYPKMSYRVFQRKQDFQAFRKKAPTLARWIRKAFRPKTTPEFDFCAALCFKLLGNWLGELGVPLSYRTLVNNAERIAPLIDQAFPGYQSAGFLNRVIGTQVEGRRGCA